MLLLFIPDLLYLTPQLIPAQSFLYVARDGTGWHERIHDAGAPLSSSLSLCFICRTPVPPLVVDWVGVSCYSASTDPQQEGLGYYRNKSVVCP